MGERKNLLDLLMLRAHFFVERKVLVGLVMKNCILDRSLMLVLVIEILNLFWRWLPVN